MVMIVLFYTLILVQKLKPVHGLLEDFVDMVCKFTYLKIFNYNIFLFKKFKGPRCRHRHIKKPMCTLYLAGFCPDGPNCKLGQYPFIIFLLFLFSIFIYLVFFFFFRSFYQKSFP